LIFLIRKKRIGYNIWKYLNQQNQLRKDKYISYFKGGKFVRGQYWKNWKNIKIVGILQYALNTALVLLAIALCILLGKEIFYIISDSILNPVIDVHYQLLDRILMYFLYFEFIAMVVKYFEEEYHFPIRYFLYIGITAMIRIIIIIHENPLHTLLFSLVILVLIISFYIMNETSVRKRKY
jgi:protein PsiE